MSFNDTVLENKPLEEATSKIKVYKVLSSIGLNKVLYLRGGLISSDIGIVNMHPSKETHWVYMYVN